MSSKKNDNDLIDQLGKRSDFHLAARFNKSPVEVREMRESRKIAQVSDSFQRRAIDWTAAKEKLLGTMPDIAVASRLKTSNHVVIYRRKQLGIAPVSYTHLTLPTILLV